jgi:5-methylcytosine-specific restriction protein A
MQRRMHPLCAECLRNGIITAAHAAHHLQAHHGNLDVFRLSPLESLCASCHNRFAQQIERVGYSRAIGADGYPIDPMHPFHRNDRKLDQLQSKKPS